jgi:hypothetical protein
MKAAGLATRELFDPLGLVFLLLWKKDETVALADPVKAKYYVCAAYMHPHFADLINGMMPEDYNVCTATRWWNIDEDKRRWFNTNNDKNYISTFNGAYMKRYITAGDKTWWVSDKIRKPFFRLTSDGRIEESPEVKNAITAEDKRSGSSTKPLRKLIDILMYVYFQEPINDRTPQETVKPGTDGNSGNAGNAGNTVTAGNSVTAGNAGNAVTAVANDPAALTGSTTNPPVPQDQADDASKGTGTGTGTPAPTGTGVPATEESFWDKNKYIIIIIGVITGVVFLAIVAIIFLRMRNRDESDDYGDPAGDIELEGTEDLLGDDTDLKFGF